LSETRWQPYGASDGPVSAGKVPLANFLQDFLDAWPASSGDLPATFDDRGEDGDGLRSAIRFLGHLILEGDIKSYVRPMGGGEIERFPPEKWEIDDFVPRFRHSACDPIKWMDTSAEPTHWVFVNGEDVENFLKNWDVGLDPENNSATSALGPPRAEDIVRLPTVLQRTGLSRSTLYELIKKGRFPKPFKISERSSGWRTADIQEWLIGAGRPPKA
jgi:predicted DNA-binding transcriptional regulator AlpA